MRQVLYNAQLVAANAPVLSADSEALRFGAGLFETLRLRAGQPCFLERHWQRIATSADALSINRPAELSCESLDGYVRELATLEGIREGVARLSWHVRGRETDWLLSVTPPRPLPRTAAEGFRVKVPDQAERCQVCRLGGVVGHKSNSYLGNWLALRHARSQAFDESLLAFEANTVADAATATAFFVLEGQLVTASQQTGALPGVIRGLLLETLPVIERRVTFDELAHVEAAFLTNALMGVMPVSQLGQRELPLSHPLTNAAITALDTSWAS